MYAVTQDFKNNIFATSRSLQGRVTFDISPTDLETDTLTVTTSDEFYVSLASTQISNNIRQQTQKLVTWETNRLLLDGTFSFPSDSSAEWGEVGFVSEGISDANGYFGTIVTNVNPPAILLNPVPETVTMTYGASHTSAGVTVTFDPLMNEYAVDFTVTAYDASNIVVFTQTITGNTDVQRKVIGTVANFKKIVISITRWSKGYRHARIAEVDAGIVLVYTNEELIRFNLAEEMDPIASNLVIPEFEFTVDNSSSEFDPLNPSGIYASLQLRQRIFGEIGLNLSDRVEWVPLGLFYLSEWRSDQGGMTATFRGRSKLDLLESNYFEQLTPQTGYSLGTMAIQVLSAAGIGNYSIDPALLSISTNGLIKKSTCREVLQLIAIAAQATIRITRDDVLRIETTRANSVAGTVTFDEYLEEPQIDQGKQVHSGTVSYFTTLDTATGSVTVTDSNVSNGEVITLDSNTLINTNAHATAVATWLKARRNEYRLLKVNWRGNPAVELYDRLIFENRYVINQNVFVTKQELRYEGYLSGYIEARAVT